MQYEDKIINNINQRSRRQRRNGIKNLITIIIIVFFMLPTIFCFIFINKIHALEKQVIRLQSIEEDIYDKEEGNSSLGLGDSSLVYAADNNSKVDELNTNITNNYDTTNNEDQLNGLENKEDYLVDDKTLNNTNDNIEEDKKNNKNDSHINNNNDNVINKDKKNDEKENLDKSKSTKKIYLTFDDGPSANTGKLLDILSKNHVKATFFVIGKTDEQSKAMYKRIVDEGHTLGMHSYSHKYDIIYNSVNDFDKDFNKISDLIFDATGYRSTLYRFPGGSSNVVSKVKMTEFIKYLNKKEIVYFDWNASNGDATNKKISEKELIENVITGVNMYNSSVILMHDMVTKESTLNSLNKLIKTLKDENVEILPIDDTVKPVQHIKYDSVE